MTRDRWRHQRRGWRWAPPPWWIHPTQAAAQHPAEGPV